MLEAFGDAYIFDHISVEIHKESQKLLYQAYVTDALMAISQRNQAINKRYIDIINQASNEETRSAEDIKTDLKDRLNGKGKER